jgi:hypothetical protein
MGKLSGLRKVIVSIIPFVPQNMTAILDFNYATHAAQILCHIGDCLKCAIEELKPRPDECFTNDRAEEVGTQLFSAVRKYQH